MAFNELLNLVRGTTAITPSPEEFNVLDGAIAGTAVAGKAVVLDANKATDEVNAGEVNTPKLSLGAAGAEVEVTATAAEINAIADKSVNGAVRKYKAEAITIAASTDPQDFTTLAFSDNTIITNVWIKTVVPEETGNIKTVSIGVSGAAGDAFLTAVDVSAAGINQGVLSTPKTLGPALSLDVSGDGTLFIYQPFVCSDDITLSYTLGSADFAELQAVCIVEYIEFA